jgi:2-polyprenyl-3-methyl-5-hydroxy-6-metoxy-1,4-benzoquinol methylase
MKSKQELLELHNKNYVNRFKAQKIIRLKRLIKFVTLDSSFKIADFGCGNGLLMELVASKSESYTGIDFSESFIEAAVQKKISKNISNANFICSDIQKFCQQNLNCFDVAFAMDIAEHIYDKEWVSNLCNIKKTIKPHGKLYVHTPNANFFIEILKKNNFILKQFPEHIAVRTPQDNIKLIELAGFKKIKIFFLPHYNILKFFHIFSYIPFLGKFFKARIFIEATV